MFVSQSRSASQFGGMVLQNSYNKKAEKRQDKYNRGMADYQVMKQNDMNEQARRTNMKMWEDTNYRAQAEQMRKAGLNVGLMYGMGGGAGGSTGNAGGSASVGSVQIHAPDAQGAMSGMGMSLMNAAQVALLKAQKENVEADTQNKIESTPGVSADSRNKSMNADLTEETYDWQVKKLTYEAVKARGEAESAQSKGWVDIESAQERANQEKLKTIQMGVELRAKEAGIELTEAEIKETTAKIDKIVAEISNMKELTEARKLEVLQKEIQTQFNTSTPAQIKQWTDIGVDILRATKGGGSRNTTINQTGS
jgi:hypothetical protein